MEQPLIAPSRRAVFNWRLAAAVVATLCATALVATFFFNDLENTSAVVHGVCDHAHDAKESCLAVVAEVSNQGVYRDRLLDELLMDSFSRVNEAFHRARLLAFSSNDVRTRAGLNICVELMDLSKDRITNTMNALRNADSGISDAHTWLSTVLTNHVTCLDEITNQEEDLLFSQLNDLVLRARTILAVLVRTYSLSTVATGVPKGRYPSWLTRKDRMLLRAEGKNVAANSVVAKDGSGQYTTISDAVDAAPANSKTRYVIYVKKGIYKEKVQIAKKNIMLVGDGMGSTIVTGSSNVVDGDTTYNSATVAAVGDGFMAQDMCFQNTAGPEKHQAVALRVGADQAVINRCKIDGYQDTLYAHSNRQFYRDCYITGTVDFIFGNAAVVFQSCNIVPRKPMPNQSNMVTAQGRTDPNQNTGTSIQNCNIVASSDLQPVKTSFRSYLGRPWKVYSRTVVMQSNIGDCIEPAGWSEWEGSIGLSTLYYGEYLNRGPGSSTGKRVSWAGYHVMKASDAQKFTVVNLIQGDAWLDSAYVTFSPGL